MQAITFKFICTLLLLTVSALSIASKPEIYSHKRKGAIKGTDVVAYFSLQPGEKAIKGSKEFTHKYKGATFRFVNQANLDTFKATPEKYVPQYGGYCAFAISKNFTTSIRPDSWRIIEGKLYLNHNKSSQRTWDKNMSERIAAADANWPTVLSR